MGGVKEQGNTAAKATAKQAKATESNKPLAFQKGRSGNPAGLKPGTKQRMTVEIRTLAGRLFDADYWRSKYERLHNGTEHPKIEGLLLTYAFGLPQREDRDDDAVPSTVISLGPLDALHAALQQLQNQHGHSLDAPDIALPDVTVQPTTPVSDAVPQWQEPMTGSRITGEPETQ